MHGFNVVSEDGEGRIVECEAAQRGQGWRYDVTVGSDNLMIGKGR